MGGGKRDQKGKAKQRNVTGAVRCEKRNMFMGAARYHYL